MFAGVLPGKFRFFRHSFPTSADLFAAGWLLPSHAPDGPINPGTPDGIIKMMHAFRKTTKLYLFSLFCVISTASSSQELWTACRIILPLTQNIELQPEFQIRFHHDPSLQDYAHLYRLRIKYSLNERWKFGSTIRVTDNQETESISVSEIPDRKRYTLDIYSKLPLKNDRTTIDNRLRFQISQTKKLNYNYYLRYRLGLEYALVRNVEVTVSDEIYIEYPEIEICLNKTSLNIELSIIKGFRQNFFYTVETNLQSESSIFNYIIGCRLEINPKKLFN